MRPGEEVLVERMLAHSPVTVDKPKYTDPHTKANALLQVRAVYNLHVYMPEGL